MSDVLSREAIVLGGQATDRDAAITEAGQLLVAAGAVDEAYVDAMHERETSVSTFMGNGLAIPHGTNEAKALIRQHGHLVHPLRRADRLEGQPGEVRRRHRRRRRRPPDGAAGARRGLHRRRQHRRARRGPDSRRRARRPGTTSASDVRPRSRTRSPRRIRRGLRGVVSRR